MATIRTHTTLRGLFAATAVFAVLAAMWSAQPRKFLLHVSLTPSGLSFVAAILGVPLLGAMVIAFVVGLLIDAYFIATLRYSNLPAHLAIWEARDDTLFIVCLCGTLWLTAWWWGTYLRYVWSNPNRRFEPLPDDEVSWDAYLQRFTFYERMLARCDVLPVGFFTFSVMVNVAIWFGVKGLFGVWTAAIR